MERLYILSYEKMNEDTKFMSETTRFADQPSPNQDLLNSICNIIVTGAPTGGDIIKVSLLFSGNLTRNSFTVHIVINHLLHL